MAPFLMRVASQGLTVIANGAIANNSRLMYESLSSYPCCQPTDMKIAFEWAAKQALDAKYGHFDLSKLAAARQSCSSFETETMSSDSRIKTLGILKSGNMASGGSKGAGPKGGAGGAPERGKGDASKGPTQRKRLPQMGSTSGPDASTYKVPAFYFLGCPSDMALHTCKLYPYISSVHSLTLCKEK
jgi:hypothetical protein